MQSGPTSWLSSSKIQRRQEFRFSSRLQPEQMYTAAQEVLMTHFSRFVNLTIAALYLTCLLPAQTITGTITGAVKDSSDAVIVGAKVILIHEATRVQRQTITSDAGDFTFSSVQPGSYTLTVDHPGF